MLIPLLSSLLAFASPEQASIYLRQGNCYDAIRVYPAPTEDHYRLAIGKCHLQMGQLSSAEAILSEVDGSLKKHATRYRSATALLAGETYKAQILAEELLQDPDLREEAQLLKAKAAVANEQYIVARDSLRPLLSGKRADDGYLPAASEIDPAEIRWLLAEGARRRGSANASISAYWKIWTANPTSAYSALAEEKLIALGERVPNSTTEKGRTYIKARARTFRKLQLHKEALTLLDLLPQPNDQASLRKFAYYTFSAKDYPRTLKVFQSLEAPTDEDLFHMALASVRSGDYDGSADYYMQILEQFPASKRADTASFKLGYLEYDLGNLEKALPLFSAHLERFPKSRHADEARYFMGWSLTKLERYEEAQKAFTLVQTLHSKSSLAAGAAFWHAVIQEEAGLTEKSKESFEYVLKMWPTSGYSWHAARYLGKEFPKKELASLPELPAILDRTEYHLGLELAEVGFENLAQANLLPLRAIVKGDKAATLTLAHALIEAGAYRPAQKIAGPYCTKPWKGGNPLAMQACYPKPHQDIIEATIGEHPLNSNLPFAIMTAESGLKPEVSSPAGARGMMQLMPYLAEELHQTKFPHQPYDADQLFQSGYNVTLGTTELMGLLTGMQDLKLADPLPMVIAGYNGGEEAVRRWMGLYEDAPTPEQFSDDIGYTETRRYNRRVLGYLMIYRYVYGD